MRYSLKRVEFFGDFFLKFNKEKDLLGPANTGEFRLVEDWQKNRPDIVEKYRGMEWSVLQKQD